MNKEELQRLIERINNHTASGEELRIYNAWCNAAQEQGAEAPDLSEIQTGMLRNIHERIDRKGTVRRLPKYRTVAAAASLLLCLGFAGYYLMQDNRKQSEQASVPEQPANDVLPGGNKAFLTLADGSKVSLTDAARGNLIKQPGATITKTTAGQLVYTPAGNSTQPGDPGSNTISTPNGGRWQVSLSDGSRVWLNAASTLTYPASFASAGERRVLLSGEAYFEVAQDPSKPFIVQAADQRIEVLGTHFNVNAYKDDGALTTTLLEGSVKVTAHKMEKTIRPGEEAVLKQGRLQVGRADADRAMAWKNGMFRFDQEDLQSIMKKIARWYDVEIEYADQQVKQLTFNGIITQFGNVSKVLRMLELTEQVHFEIRGRKITVIGGIAKH